MIFSDVKSVLILAPHPDDAEFGLGASLVKMKAMGIDIHLAVFSLCEASTPKGMEVGVIEKEFYASCSFLGIEKKNIHVMDFPVRDFPAHRQAILEAMIRLREEIKPELVFIPSSSDIHQDHFTVNAEGKRAFKHYNLLGYEMPWNNFGFTSYVFVKITKEELESKLAAIDIYESQKSRPYINRDFITSLCRLRGGQILEEYAESFELIRLIQS